MVSVVSRYRTVLGERLREMMNIIPEAAPFKVVADRIHVFGEDDGHSRGPVGLVHAPSRFGHRAERTVLCSGVRIRTACRI